MQHLEERVEQLEFENAEMKRLLASIAQIGKAPQKTADKSYDRRTNRAAG